MKSDLAEKGMLVTVFWLPLVNAVMYVALIISFFSSLKKEKKFTDRNNLDYAVIIFIFIVFLSVLVSVNKLLSIYGFVAFCAYPIAYFIFAKNLNEANLLKITRLITFSLVIVLIVAAAQLVIPVSFLYKNKEFFNLLGWDINVSVWRGARFVSTLGNPNILGSYLILVLPILMCLFLQKQSLKTGLIFTAGVICLLLTYSRSAWIGFIAGFFVLFVILKKRLLILFVLLFLIPFSVVPRLGNRFKSIVSSDTAYGIFGRTAVWQTSLNIIKKYPLLGAGVNTFYYIYPKFQPEGSIDRFPHAHNILLHLGAEIGLIGAAAFCVLMFLFFKFSLKIYSRLSEFNDGCNLRWIVPGIVSSVVGFVVQNLGDCTFVRGQMGVLFWAMMGMVRGLSNLQKIFPSQKELRI